MDIRTAGQATWKTLKSFGGFISGTMSNARNTSNQNTSRDIRKQHRVLRHTKQKQKRPVLTYQTVRMPPIFFSQNKI
jgi:hypothetical protein